MQGIKETAQRAELWPWRTLSTVSLSEEGPDPTRFVPGWGKIKRAFAGAFALLSLAVSINRLPMVPTSSLKFLWLVCAFPVVCSSRLVCGRELWGPRRLSALLCSGLF